MLMIDKIEEKDLIDYAVEKFGMAIDIAEKVISMDCELREIIIDKFLNDRNNIYGGLN